MKTMSKSTLVRLMAGKTMREVGREAVHDIPVSNEPLTVPVFPPEKPG